MLRITIPSGDYYDERKQEFYHSEGQKILLEHSLVSLAKWEARWHKPFLSAKEMSRAETIDYIRCMTLTENVNPMAYSLLTNSDLDMVTQYINEPMTATTFSKRQGEGKGSSRKIITAEVIYYWMVALQIPFEPCERWHLNKLLTLIKVCNIEGQPKKKKLSALDTMKENTELNRARRKKLGTKG